MLKQPKEKPACATLASLLIVAAIAVPFDAHAQVFDRLSNPTVEVIINHPPALGIQVNKVAFGPATGKCSDEIVASLIDDFVSNQIEVVDRQNLSALLAEHKLSTSSYLDQASTAAIGRILGPSAMVFVKTTRCDTVQDRVYDTEKRYDSKSKTYYSVYAYYGRTRVFLRASVQIVDLATGRIFAARTLEQTPSRSNKSYEGYPEAPAAFDVLDVALKAAVNDIHKMLFPWAEKTELVFYDDKSCNLKQAFQYLKAGSTELALQQSLSNLDACKNEPKVKDSTLGHSYYNVGIGYMIQSDHDTALEFLQKAAQLRPGEIVTKAIADCQRAKALSVEMQQLEARVAFEAANEQTDGTSHADAGMSSALTNEDVIQMTRGKLPAAVIIHKIENSKRNFDTSPTGLSTLTKAGVDEAVLIKMISP